jgi:hypothetical protein
MSCSDYTIVRRLRHMNKLPCNVTPTITHHQYPQHQNHHQHQHQNQQYHDHQQQYQQHQYQHQHQHHQNQHQCHQHTDNTCNLCANNCNIAPNSCTTIQPTICTDNTVCCDDSAYINDKYITKTKNAYKIVPIKDASIGVLVEPYLPFKTGDLISFHRKSAVSNYFNGVVLNYDAGTGFLSIGNFDNITGTFSESYEYIVNSILFDPETVRLKQRMEWLYQKLYQVDLEIKPDFNPNDTTTTTPTTDYEKLEVYIYNLNNYLFDVDIRLKTDYAVTDTFLTQCIDNIYYNLFEVTDLSNFNPNGNDVALTSLENKIYEIYIYLFSVDLAQNDTYNPNATV